MVLRETLACHVSLQAQLMHEGDEGKYGIKIMGRMKLMYGQTATGSIDEGLKQLILL